MGEYALIDFGQGRRLERFGPFMLDRPCPAAEKLPLRDPAAWQHADSRFEREDGQEGHWVDHRAIPDAWIVRLDAIRFELHRTSVGHLGVFPEQRDNWQWIHRRVAAEGAPRPFRILNLFAYTGGSTLAAAQAGAEVVHIDSARNTVGRARRNAEVSDLVDAPIRWIAEDAKRFVRRERKRGNTFHGVILDPPSYGHGPRGEVWRLSKHLRPLLDDVAAILDPEAAFLLLTCHTPGWPAARLASLWREVIGSEYRSGDLRSGPLRLASDAGRHLPAGEVVTWTSD